MFRSLATILLLLLSACGPDPFGLRDTPRTATEVAYAKEVCDSAGRQSRACIDARHQMDLQCYRTLGTVDCYRSSDPFDNTASGRTVVTPLDRRTPPQPVDLSEETEEEEDKAPVPALVVVSVPEAEKEADTKTEPEAAATSEEGSRDTE